MNDLSEIFDKHKKSVVTFIDGVRNEAYKQGCIDAIEHLVKNGYIKYGFDTAYLIEQMGKEQKK